jgi:dTDP-4-amino-4,6-dideoxygalactose transaminase
MKEVVPPGLAPVVPLLVPMTRPELGEAEAAGVARVLASRWLAQGPEVAAFEKELAAAVGAPHAVAVSHGTAALELALRALDVGPGDDVLTVSHSFIATANVVWAVGARSVFVDVDERTFGLDPARLALALTPRTRALLVPHQIGFPCDLPAILAFAAQHGLPVIEDAACALGSEIAVGGRWERIGKPHGVMACFSFHPRKVITMGEGGAVTTADEALSRRIRGLRQHAISVSSEARVGAAAVAFESFAEPAFNARLTDLQAAVGRPQLARLDAIIAERRRWAVRFQTALQGHPLLTAVPEPTWARVNWQSFPVRFDPAQIDQAALLSWLLSRGLSCRRGVGNAHQEPAYAVPGRWVCGPESCVHELGGTCPALAVSQTLRDSTILLPLFHGMTENEAAVVVKALDELREPGAREALVPGPAPPGQDFRGK